MQITACILFLFSLLPYTGSQEDKWQRLYTFKDTTVDVETSNIVFSTDFTGRIKFRITLSKPEPVPENPGIKYKSVVETIEFKCPERLYRVIEVKRYDGKGNVVDENKADSPVPWKDLKPGSMMDRFFTPGCETIYKKRRNP